MISVRTSVARTTAIQLLSRIDPVEYGRSRNHLDGAVTRLSRFLRHGVLSLAEVRDAAVAKAGNVERCFKLIQELAWRDYHQRVWGLIGDRIWSDLEPFKTGFESSDYADELPHDLLNAATGIDYIDHFVRELHDTGYLHNHARMWMAAYVVHGRRVKWQAGARWFLSHLLDGDEASNNLSWQWCAGTFSHKPYFFNRENVLKYSGSRFAARQADDPFDADYDTLARRLFREPAGVAQASHRTDLRTEIESAPASAVPTVAAAKTLVWVHDGMMSPEHPAVALGEMSVFVWDDRHIAAQNHSAGRIAFQRSALFCDDVHSQGRPLEDVIFDLARAGGFEAVVTGSTPDPRLLRAIQQLAKKIRVHVVPDRPFVKLAGRIDLARFSRYWANAESRLFAADGA